MEFANVPPQIAVRVEPRLLADVLALLLREAGIPAVVVTSDKGLDGFEFVIASVDDLRGAVTEIPTRRRPQGARG